MSSFFPPTDILLVSAALAACRFENQRWVRARASGMRGSSFALGLIPELIGFTAMLFGLIFLIAVGSDFGWKATVGLILFSFGGVMIWTIISTIVTIKIFRRPDNVMFWLLGTILTVPLVIYLFTKVSWFGFMS